MFVGGTVGGFVPLLWGDSALSMSGIVGNTIGGVVGIWAGFKLGKMMGA